MTTNGEALRAQDWILIVRRELSTKGRFPTPQVKPPNRFMGRRSKRVVDCALASVGILAFLPIMGVIGLAVKLDSPGPMLFRQRRKGLDGQTFKIFKFRTMHVLEDGAIRQARAGDDRVTRVGAVLRRTSLDEVPQLFNVLRGDMSLVGPRPHAVAHDDQCIQAIVHYRFRHLAKPGITGWAQVNGLRGGTGGLKLMEQRVTQDLWYINNWSIHLDLWILLRTCVEIVRGRNAY